MKQISETLNEISNNFIKLLDQSIPDIQQASKLIIKSLQSGKKIMFCGNGGSAADAQHLSAELVGRYMKNRKPLASIALTTDTSILTSVGNDYGFDQIFSRQLEALGSSGDILVGISTSGNSKNILNAFKVASDLGVTSIALTGKDGGIAKQISDYSIVVDSDSTARIQEAHILIGHILCEIIEDRLQFV